MQSITSITPITSITKDVDCHIMNLNALIKQHGSASHTFPSGIRYFKIDDKYYLGYANGFQFNYYGCCKYKDGSYYYGGWVEGERYGSGTYMYADGTTYVVGNWKNGALDGYGHIFYGNGSIFKGDFKNGLPNGSGTLKTQHSIKSGRWLNGALHGPGKEIFINGNTYVGNFFSDVKCGEGTIYYADGGKLSCTWKDDKKEGKGVYLFPDCSKKYEGIWKDDKNIEFDQVMFMISIRSFTNNLRLVSAANITVSSLPLCLTSLQKLTAALVKQ